MRYLAWFVGLIGVVLVVIFGVIIIRNTLRGYRAPSNTNTVVQQVNNGDLANTTVQLTIGGPVVANENYRSLFYSINQNSRQASSRSGYQNTTIQQLSYSNNSDAFTAFANALDVAGFGRERQRRTGEEAGACATGRTYAMVIIRSGQVVSNLWTTSCFGGARGTFGGNLSSVLSLFQRQIPGNSQLTSNIGGTF